MINVCLQVIVQLADVHMASQWTVQLILWDNYVAFIRLFDKVGTRCQGKVHWLPSQCCFCTLYMTVESLAWREISTIAHARQ